MPLLTRAITFVTSLLLPAQQSPSEKGSTLKEKKPTLFSLCEQNIFRRKAKQILKNLHLPEFVLIPIKLSYACI